MVSIRAPRARLAHGSDEFDDRFNLFVGEGPYPEGHRFPPPLDHLRELRVGDSGLPNRICEVWLMKHKPMAIGCVAFNAIVGVYPRAISRLRLLSAIKITAGFMGRQQAGCEPDS